MASGVDFDQDEPEVPTTGASVSKMTREQVSLHVLDSVSKHTMSSDRARQQAEHRIGASEIGLCRSYLKFMTIGAEYDPPKDPKWPAFIGTAIGDLVEKAYKAEHPHAIIQAEFECELPSGLRIPCHSDIIDPELNMLIDVKTKDGLALVRATDEPSRQYRYQVAIYLLGAVQAGLLEEGARALLVYMDRSGGEYMPVTHEVVLDAALIEEIDEWIADANYAVINGVEAPKDQPYEFCEAYCAFFTTCRGGESLAEGLISDEDAALALKVHIEAAAEEKAAKARKEQAKKVLAPFAANGGYIVSDDGVYELSQTIIGASTYTVDRKESVRMNLRKKKG